MKKLKKILVRQTGKGKSFECFRIANKFKGVVLYFSRVCEKHYEKIEGFSDFVVVNRDVEINDIVPFKNGKKYFFVANSSVEVNLGTEKAAENILEEFPFSVEKIAMLFEKDNKNIFLEGITDDILIIIDDGYWYFQENPYRNLWLLGQTKNNVIISVQAFEELLNEPVGSQISTKNIRKLCKKCGWKLV